MATELGLEPRAGTRVVPPGRSFLEQHYVQTFLNQRVDGIVVTGKSSDARPSITGLLGVPAVYALSPSLDPDDVSIVPDDEAGAARAIGHLLGSGRRSIAVISGARRHVASSHRVDSARRAIQAAGVTLAGGEAMYGGWSERWGYEAATRLLGTDVDGVFCTSDQIARGVVDCLREAGVSVPTQVGVVGVDNWSVITDAARPSITSVDLNLREVGRSAADLLMRMISGERVEGRPDGGLLLGAEAVDVSVVAAGIAHTEKPGHPAVHEQVDPDPRCGDRRRDDRVRLSVLESARRGDGRMGDALGRDDQAAHLRVGAHRAGDAGGRRGGAAVPLGASRVDDQRRGGGGRGSALFVTGATFSGAVFTGVRSASAYADRLSCSAPGGAHG